MKSFYSNLAIVMATLSLSATASAQTTVLESSDCGFVRNFNAGTEGFTSTSIFSDADDATFFYNASAGAFIESSGITSRDASIISPVYPSMANGQTTVGFTYAAPAGTQYRIRVISGSGPTTWIIAANTSNGTNWRTLPATSGAICLNLLNANITMGTQIRYEITFRANGASDILFDNFTTSVANAPLPVTFLGVIGNEKTDGSVNIRWNVAEEVDVLHYEVLSSTDGVNYTTIGTVPANGKSVYSFADAQNIGKTRYYRVRNKDIDGKSKESSVVVIRGKGLAQGTISLYPVPARDLVTVQHDKARPGTVINLVSLTGRVMQTVRPTANDVNTPINIGTLAPGTYLIQYQDDRGAVQTSKFVKQ